MQVTVRLAAGCAWPWPERGKVVVIDVLRATTSMVAALANGCREVIPLARPDEALALKQEAMLLAGEQGGLMIPGFDLGNSPLEFTAPKVGGKVVAMVTTNGTRAVQEAASPAREVLIAGFVNAGAVVKALPGEDDVVLFCAGREGQFSLEDFAAAGLLATELLVLHPAPVLSDLARAACAVYNQYRYDLEGLLCQSWHGRRLASLGFAGDLAFCSSRDLFDLAPRLSGGRIRL